MAQRTIVHVTDDLDGSNADTTVTLGVDGATYELDLSSNNADQMRKVLQPYVEAARRIGGRTRGGTPRGPVEVGVDNAAVRAWAASNNVPLNQRGRIPRSVVEQFKAAMG